MNREEDTTVFAAKMKNLANDGPEVLPLIIKGEAKEVSTTET